MVHHEHVAQEAQFGGHTILGSVGDGVLGGERLQQLGGGLQGSIGGVPTAHGGESAREQLRLLPGLSGDAEVGEVFVGDEGKRDVDLEDFNFEPVVHRKVRAPWDLMRVTKEYLAVMPCLLAI